MTGAVSAMQQEQRDRIPDAALYQRDTKRLRAWLAERGLQMTLAELAAERRYRRPRTRHRTEINRRSN